MTTTQKAVRVLEKNTGTEFVRATATLHHIEGNKSAHFSITGEVYELRMDGKPCREPFACGQVTDEIVAAFPDIERFMGMHLSDENGVPMHAIANGAYWLGLGDPRYVPEGAPKFDVVARLWRMTEDEVREIHAYASEDGNATEAIRFCLKGHEARWMREAEEFVAWMNEAMVSA